MKFRNSAAEGEEMAEGGARTFLVTIPCRPEARGPGAFCQTCKHSSKKVRFRAVRHRVTKRTWRSSSFCRRAEQSAFGELQPAALRGESLYLSGEGEGIEKRERQEAPLVLHVGSIQLCVSRNEGGAAYLQGCVSGLNIHFPPRYVREKFERGRRE